MNTKKWSTINNEDQVALDNIDNNVIADYLQQEGFCVRSFDSLAEKENYLRKLFEEH